MSLGKTRHDIGKTYKRQYITQLNLSQMKVGQLSHPKSPAEPTVISSVWGKTVHTCKQLNLLNYPVKLNMLMEKLSQFQTSSLKLKWLQGLPIEKYQISYNLKRLDQCLLPEHLLL